MKMSSSAASAVPGSRFGSAYYYDLSYMVRGDRPANGTRPGPTAMSWSARAQSEPAAA